MIKDSIVSNKFIWSNDTYRMPYFCVSTCYFVVVYHMIMENGGKAVKPFKLNCVNTQIIIKVINKI